MPEVIALLTDFGLRDIYVGAMKAVILSICPSARIVDITHAIQRQNTREGAFALMNSCQYFPPGTVFCAVVDPGVGSERLAIAVESQGYRFVGPDNGVLSYALARTGAEYAAVKLENPQYRAEAVSHTFHGRDIFAPAAAHLAREPVLFASMGGALESIAQLPAPELRYARQRLIGEALHIDHFGNIITSIGELRWANAEILELADPWRQSIPPLRFSAKEAQVTIHSHTAQGILSAYHQAGPGEILAQIDSNGFLEIGANQGDAADRLDVKLGDKVMLRLA